MMNHIKSGRMWNLFARQGMQLTSTSLNARSISYLYVSARVINLYNTVLGRSTELKSTIQYTSFKMPQAYLSIAITSPRAFQIQLSKRIMALKSIEDLLGLFSNNMSMDKVNRLTVLHNIAKIVQKDAWHKEKLKHKKQATAYKKLLDSFSKDVPQCNPRDLADLIWALGKMQETQHSLVAACEKEMLSRDISLFTNTQVCQIISACSLLGMKGESVMSKMEEAILQGKLKSSTFKDWDLNGILMSFAKCQTVKGSNKLHRHLLLEILQRNFMEFNNQSLVGFVWSCGELALFNKELFTRVEKEILRRGTSGLKNVEILMALTAFAKAGKGSKVLFTSFNNELLFRNIQGFDCGNLQHVVQFFALRGIKNAEVFDLVEIEVLRRGLAEFKAYHLVWIVWSFVKAERNSQQLIKDCLNELCSRDLTQLDNGNFASLAWCIGRSGLVNHMLLDTMEQIMLERNASDLTIKQILALKRGFIEARRESRKLFDHLEPAVRKQIRNLSARDICDLLWCVSRPGFETGSVISAIENEVLMRGKAYFNNEELQRIKNCFAEAELKGSPELFEMLEGHN